MVSLDTILVLSTSFYYSVSYKENVYCFILVSRNKVVNVLTTNVMTDVTESFVNLFFILNNNVLIFTVAHLFPSLLLGFWKSKLYFLYMGGCIWAAALNRALIHSES